MVKLFSRSIIYSTAVEVKEMELESDLFEANQHCYQNRHVSWFRRILGSPKKDSITKYFLIKYICEIDPMFGAITCIFELCGSNGWWNDKILRLQSTHMPNEVRTVFGLSLVTPYFGGICMG